MGIWVKLKDLWSIFISHALFMDSRPQNTKIIYCITKKNPPQTISKPILKVFPWCCDREKRNLDLKLKDIWSICEKPKCTFEQYLSQEGWMCKISWLTVRKENCSNTFEIWDFNCQQTERNVGIVFPSLKIVQFNSCLVTDWVHTILQDNQ